MAPDRAAATAAPGDRPPATGLDARVFAGLLVGYCLDVQEGEQVLVRSTTLAAPLLLEVQRAVLERGGWPLLRVELPGQTQAFYEHVRDWQLDDFAPLALAEARKAACTLGIQAPDEDSHPYAVDPERLRRATLARKPLRDAVMKTRWCTTLWPTPAAAARAATSLDELHGPRRRRPLPRPARPRRGLGRPARLPGTADRAAARRAAPADRGRRDRSRPRCRPARLGQLRRAPQHA